MNLLNDQHAFYLTTTVTRRVDGGHLRKTVHRRGRSETMPAAITRHSLRDVFLIPHKSAQPGRWQGVGFPQGEDVISGGINQSTPSRSSPAIRERKREVEEEEKADEEGE